MSCKNNSCDKYPLGGLVLRCRSTHRVGSPRRGATNRRAPRGSATAETHLRMSRTHSGFGNDCAWRNARLWPKTAFSRLPPVHCRRPWPGYRSVSSVPVRRPGRERARPHNGPDQGRARRRETSRCGDRAKETSRGQASRQPERRCSSAPVWRKGWTRRPHSECGQARGQSSRDYRRTSR